MTTKDTLMIRDINGRIYRSNNGNNNEPKSWLLIIFMIVFIIFEYIKYTFFR